MHVTNTHKIREFVHENIIKKLDFFTFISFTLILHAPSQVRNISKYDSFAFILHLFHNMSYEI